MKQTRITHYFHGDRSENKIALTFDDGPNPFFTEKVLRILKNHDIKATFFLIGKWVDLYPTLVRKISSEGHLIGNHTYSHSQGDFKKADKVFEKVLGRHPSFIRVPYLNLNLCRYLKDDYLKKRAIVNFDVDSKDWENLSSTEIIKHVKNRINNGSIIDFHDGSESKKQIKKRPIQMVKALSVLLDILRREYHLVKIDELSLVPQEKIFLKY